MAKVSRPYWYEFEDGYCCWLMGKLKGSDRKMYIIQHGKILVEKI